MLAAKRVTAPPAISSPSAMRVIFTGNLGTSTIAVSSQTCLKALVAISAAWC